MNNSIKVALLMLPCLLLMVHAKTVEDFQKICAGKKTQSDCTNGCNWQAGVCIFTCENFKGNKDTCDKVEVCEWKESGPAGAKITSCELKELKTN